MKKLLILLSLAASCAAQNIDTLPSVTGADIAAGDKLLLRDVSRPATTAGQPMVATTIDQLVAVPSFFTNLPNGSFSLSKLAQSGATTGQVPTWNGTTWVPGEAGEEITNASVNAAIAEDPAASRAAVGAAPIRLLAPNAAVRLQQMNVIQAYSHLTVFGFGDSLGDRIVSGLEARLTASPGVVGYALDAVRNDVASGTVVAPGLNGTANFQPTIYDSGRVWNMSSGAVIKISRPEGGSGQKGVISSACIVWAAKQPGGGTLTLEYSNDGGSTWISSGLTGSNTVSTDGTAGEIARISVTHGESLYRFWRITASGGPVNYVGAKIWNSYASGIVLAASSNGGLRVDQAIQGGDALRNQIGTDLGQSVMLAHFHEGSGEADQSEISEMLSNWSTALPSSDIIIVGQTSHAADPNGTNRDIVNGYWKTAIAANPRSAFLDTEGLIPNDYMENIGWNDPDSLHKDNAVWQTIGAHVWAAAVGGAQYGLGLNALATTGNTKDFVFGSLSDKPVDSLVQSYMFPLMSAARGRVGLYGINRTTGGGTITEAYWQPASHPKLPNGVALRSFGGPSAWVITIDQTGSVRFGPYDGTFPSAYTDGAARLHVIQDVPANGGITINHTSASATWLQRWQLQGATQAEMRKNGELNLKTITTPAAYADDAAAAAAGIPVGGIYRKTDGTVVWRQI